MTQEKKQIWHTPDVIPNDVWAYKKDVEATSKALDVAIDRLTHLAECPYQGGVQGVKMGVTVYASAGLQEIEKIMKGDK